MVVVEEEEVEWVKWRRWIKRGEVGGKRGDKSERRGGGGGRGMHYSSLCLLNSNSESVSSAFFSSPDRRRPSYGDRSLLGATAEICTYTISVQRRCWPADRPLVSRFRYEEAGRDLRPPWVT